MKPFIPIYVCCHDKRPLPVNGFLVPVQAGRAMSDFVLDMQGDDDGINISNRNANYCELSVLYWIWRNTAHDCFGLCHYRRFFNLNNEETVLESFDDFSVKSGLDSENLCRLMNEYDLILPRAKAKNNGSSLYQLYAEAHHIGDLDLALRIIADIYPEMVPAAETAIYNQPLAYYKNMMISRRDFADLYCRWLFDVLRRVDCIIYPQLQFRTPYQKRVYGFLAERLFNIYLEHYRRSNRIKIKEVPLLVCQEPEAAERPVWQKASNFQ